MLRTILIFPLLALLWCTSCNDGVVTEQNSCLARGMRVALAGPSGPMKRG